MKTTARFVRDCERAKLIPAFVPTDPTSGPGVAVDRSGKPHIQFARGWTRLAKWQAGHWLRMSTKYPARGRVALYPQGIAALLEKEAS